MFQAAATAYLDESPAGSQSELTIVNAVKSLREFEAEINLVKAKAESESVGEDGSVSGSGSERAAQPATKFGFTRSELLMFLALRPTSQATLNLIVEECEERLDEAQSERLQAVVEGALPTK